MFPFPAFPEKPITFLGPAQVQRLQSHLPTSVRFFILHDPCLLCPIKLKCHFSLFRNRPRYVNCWNIQHLGVNPGCTKAPVRLFLCRPELWMESHHTRGVTTWSLPRDACSTVATRVPGEFASRWSSLNFLLVHPGNAFARPHFTCLVPLSLARQPPSTGISRQPPPSGVRMPA